MHKPQVGKHCPGPNRTLTPILGAKYCTHDWNVRVKETTKRGGGGRELTSILSTSFSNRLCSFPTSWKKLGFTTFSASFSVQIFISISFCCGGEEKMEVLQPWPWHSRIPKSADKGGPIVVGRIRLGRSMGRHWFCMQKVPGSIPGRAGKDPQPYLKPWRRAASQCQHYQTGSIPPGSLVDQKSGSGRRHPMDLGRLGLTIENKVGLGHPEFHRDGVQWVSPTPLMWFCLPTPYSPCTPGLWPSTPDKPPHTGCGFSSCIERCLCLEGKEKEEDGNNGRNFFFKALAQNGHNFLQPLPPPPPKDPSCPQADPRLATRTALAKK